MIEVSPMNVSIKDLYDFLDKHFDREDTESLVFFEMSKTLSSPAVSLVKMRGGDLYIANTDLSP